MLWKANTTHPHTLSKAGFLKTRRFLPNSWNIHFWSVSNRCLLCESQCQGRVPLCRPCQRELPWQRHACSRCALPIAGNADLCGECVRQPPSFDYSWAALLYTKPIDRLINQFKYQRRLLPGSVISHLLSECLYAELEDCDVPDVITSVPLHWRRQLLRGFNQSAVLALHLSRKWRIPYLDCCRRTQPTPRQQQLTRKQRLCNLNNAFVVRETATTSISGKHIAVVDDVITTHATAEVVARTLKQAGAARVDIWAVARTPAPH